MHEVVLRIPKCPGGRELKKRISTTIILFLFLFMRVYTNAWGSDLYAVMIHRPAMLHAVSFRATNDAWFDFELVECASRTPHSYMRRWRIVAFFFSPRRKGWVV
jgi:hypothetical protein